MVTAGPGGVPRVAVVGGGIAGLTCAFRLAEGGARVVLYEAGDQFGGLGTYFEHEGHRFERFYHVILPTDEHLLGLAGDLGIADRIYWKDTSLGFVYNRRMYDLSSPADLLRFDPVPLTDRFRLGFTAVWVGHVARPGRLDDITVADWLLRLSGRRAFERLWRPLLEAKFGDAFDSIPALWYWSHFVREKAKIQEVKGYPRGGYSGLAARLVEAARGAGASLRTGVRVEQVALSGAQPAGGPSSDRSVLLRIDGEHHEFDRVVLCTPLEQVTRLMDPESLGRYGSVLPDDLDHQGVVNVLVMLRRRLTDHYWQPVVDSGVAFRGIVETTHVIDKHDAAERHLVYLLNYVHRDSSEFGRTDADLASDYISGLRELYPNLCSSDILSHHVFRAPYVEPIWTPGYGRRIPPDELVPGRLFLATTAQVYPHVTSWNSSVGLADRVSRQVLRT